MIVRPDDYADPSADKGAAIITDDGAQPVADETAPAGEPTDRSDGASAASGEPVDGARQESEAVDYANDAHVASDTNLGVQISGEYQGIDGSRGE